MEASRYEFSSAVLEALSQAGLSPALMQALRGLEGQAFSSEREVLQSLFALEPPPRSDQEAALILRSADRHFHEALALLEAAYRHQMQDRLEEAERLYQRSIALFPTAEAHTFLGWTYSFAQRYDEAIAECHRAIAVDPDFGNPYNDIGAYLIALGRPEESIGWLERATRATRYEPRHFPWANLGRVYEHLGDEHKALECYLRAHELEPDYPVATEGIERLSVPPQLLN